jgi:hypothetical protein
MSIRRHAPLDACETDSVIQNSSAHFQFFSAPVKKKIKTRAYFFLPARLFSLPQLSLPQASWLLASWLALLELLLAQPFSPPLAQEQLSA